MADLRKMRAFEPAGICLSRSMLMVMRTLPSTDSTDCTAP